MSVLVSFVLKMMGKAGAKVAKELEAASLDPRGEQEKLLQKILNASKDSEIGREYDFKSIDSIKTFQERMPITDYDFFSEKIEHMLKGEKQVLTGEEIVHFNVTSGTLGVPKRIPVTETHVQNFSRINAKYLNYVAISACGSKWTRGKGFSLSEGTYEILPSGISVGSASSLHTARMSGGNSKRDPMGMMYTSPVEARMPKINGEYTRYLHARFALQEKNITYCNATFSSWILEILRYMECNFELLTEDIEKGTVNPKINLPEDVRESISQKIKPMPKRAKELREAAKDGFDDKKVMSLIWPKLEYFLCVGGAGFQSYTNKIIERYFNDSVKVLYMGVTSSEGLYSVPLAMNTAESMLVPEMTVMEFIPVVDGERDLSQGIKLIDELEAGKQYELLITNVSGLFRYQLKDVIEVTGFHNKTPMIRFADRVGYAINMYAEKTSEKALRQTMEDVVRKFGVDLVDYCVVPYEDKLADWYVFMLEFSSADRERISKKELGDFIEESLKKYNSFYGLAVEMGKLQPAEVRFLQEQTFALYRDLMVCKGASIAQVKPVHAAKTPYQQKFFLLLEEKE